VSAIVKTYLICNASSCATEFGVEDCIGVSVEEQRERAKSKGWEYSEGFDFCPYCKAVREAEEDRKRREWV